MAMTTLPGPAMPPPLDPLATDEVFHALLQAHRGLAREDSEALNARLVILLMEALGDRDRILAAIGAAQAPTSTDLERQAADAVGATAIGVGDQSAPTGNPTP